MKKLNIIYNFQQLFFLSILIFASPAFATTETKDNVESCSVENNKSVLISGWFEWEPYQYIKKTAQGDVLSGMDIELTKTILSEVGSNVVIDQVSWEKHVADIKTGARDIAPGATFTKERAEFAYFSQPYRYEENSLFVSKEMTRLVSFDNIGELLAQMRAQNFRLGVIDGVVYADSKLNHFIEDKANSDIIFKFSDDVSNIKSLLNKEIDGFVTDRLVGASLALKMDAEEAIKEIRLGIKAPVAFMLSKKTTTPELLAAVNNSIDNLKNSGKFNSITLEYLFPVSLLQIVNSSWFSYITIMGVIAFALSGVMLGVKDNMTFMGTLLLAIIPSSLVGLLKDFIDNDGTHSLNYSHHYIVVAIIIVILGFAALRMLEIFNKDTTRDNSTEVFLQNLQLVSDALGQASFVVIGVTCALVYRLEPISLWGPVCAFIVSNLGCIVRDLLTKDKVVTTMNGDLGAENCIFWGFIFSVFLQVNASDPDIHRVTIMVIFTLIAAFVSRILLRYFNVENIRFR